MASESNWSTSIQPDSTVYIPESGNAPPDDKFNFTSESIGINWTSSLYEGAIFIVSNGTYQYENAPRKWQHSADLLTRMFDDVAEMKDRREDFFYGLIKAYTILYDIDLHLIVLHNEKYINIDQYNFPENIRKPYNRENHAFIWCNYDNTVYSPLYIKNDTNGLKITVFKTNVVIVKHLVESLVNQVNQKALNTNQNRTAQHLDEREDDLSHMAVDDASSSANGSSSLTALQPEAPITTNTLVKQMLVKIDQSINLLPTTPDYILPGKEVSDLISMDPNPLSPQDCAGQIHRCLMVISEVVQMTVEQVSQNTDTSISTHIVAETVNHQSNAVESNSTNYYMQIDQNAPDMQSSASTHLSNTIPAVENLTQGTTTERQYGAPEILVPPKQTWRYRNMKDLGKNRLPLLPGEGAQRTPIQVRVPPKDIYPMYLRVKTQTHDDRDHRSKILVPENTIVDMTSFCNDNSLDRLQFGKCNPGDYFDPVDSCVYLLISSEEHEARKKDVRIHMFNLYQSGSITKEVIDDERLYICKLAFWLCILKDGMYEPVSTASFSDPIEED